MQIYNIADPDDGTCESYQTESKCVKPASDFESGANKCYWDYDTQTCHINDVSSSLNKIVVVAVISALVSAPVAMVVQWILSGVLSKPTAFHGDSTPNFRQKDLSVLPSSAVDRATISQISASAMLQEYKALTSKILVYRKKLIGKELQEFDGM